MNLDNEKTVQLLALSAFAVVATASVGFLLLPLPSDYSGSHRADVSSPRTAVAQQPLGTNLRQVSDWSTELPFLNLFKQARPWFTQCELPQDADCVDGWNTGDADTLDLDRRGWVRALPAPEAPGFSVAATVLALPASIHRARYVMLYEGAGELRYGLGARRLPAESRSGRDILEIDPAQGVAHIQVYRTDPKGTGDYLRNLRLVREDREALLDAGQVFNPDLLARTRPFEVLRFMEWMRANGSPVERWDQRARPEDATYTGAAGVPPELMVALANRLGVSVWVALPHRANDRYVRQLALLTRETMAAGQDIYLEYSNEVWNSTFSQQAWIRDQAQALWPSSSASDFTKVINWYGKRGAEVCRIWKEVFADAPQRVICVLGAQAANEWTATQALACPLWSGGPCIDHGIDAIAIAPYFGGYLGKPKYESELEDWTYTSDGGLDLLYQELSIGGQLGGGPDGGGLLQSWQWIEGHAAVAATHGLELLAYEAGQHLVGIYGVENNSRITELFTRFNRDPRMGTLYEQYLLGWVDRGGSTLMHFSDIATPGRYGSWGALEYVEQRSSPKYGALRAYAERGSGSLLRR